jgi:putative serine protease PepD
MNYRFWREVMDREQDAEEAGSRMPGRAGKPPRRLTAALLAGVVVLLAVIAVLAVILAGEPAASTPVRAASASPSASATLTVAEIYRQAAPSVVIVQAGTELGSGVIVTGDGAILTAEHVVARGAVTVTFADGTVSPATIVAADKATDIAELRASKLPAPVVPATLGGAAAIGAPVVAIGNPLDLTDSVSAGVVSGLDRTAVTSTGKRTGLIQFDAAVNPGSSGGPLLDNRGLVVGIVIALEAPDRLDAFAGIGFAVPIGSALGATSGGQGKGPQI